MSDANATNMESKQAPARSLTVIIVLALIGADWNSSALAQEACCFTDGSCTDVLPADCLAAGGLAGGPGTTCATVICPPTDSCSSPALAVPDNDATGVTDTISVLHTGTISDLNIYVRCTHTWVGDLILTLEHLDTGTTVIIYDRPGVPASVFGCGSNDLEIILDDEAADPIEDQCEPGPPAQFGSFSPSNPLSAFDGEDKSGTWLLTVSDNAGGDVGTLVEWCLIFDTDGDDVPDSADACPGFDDNQDADGDGVADGCDACPNDPAKSLNAGICGCGVSDADTDGDGLIDCLDQCPNDPAKIAPGLCGCGVPDADTDGDGWLDCFDNCPNDPNPLQEDGNGDGVGDACTPPPAGAGAPCGSVGFMMAPMALLGVGLVRRGRRRAQ